jgi:hypothetical protein
MRPLIHGARRGVMELKFDVYGRIEKPVAEVFDAVYNPDKLRMIACMKVYLEHGINLRDGYFK